ncbi:MAG TPA: PPOX class F420-dependent oxidoreductase [bacterium]|nr:PPOX class F420-dependent oxidoreductase [bacterium]
MTTQVTEPVRKFLEKPNFAVLATRSNGGLQATPMWFVYEDGQIVLNSSKGRAKLRNMRRHPEVALAVVDRENPYQYVQICGKVTAFDEKNGARDIDRLSQRYNGRPYPYPGGDAPEKRVTIRITPAKVTTQGF